MKVIVCGAGQVGLSIARQLALEENDVVVIDQKEALVRRVTEMLDVAGVVGYASRPNISEYDRVSGRAFRFQCSSEDGAGACAIISATAMAGYVPPGSSAD